MVIDRRMVQLRDDMGWMIQACDYETTTLVETLLDRVAKAIEELETKDGIGMSNIGIARWLRGQP